jgi:uncharacterized protein
MIISPDCEIPVCIPSPDEILEILERCRTIAVVGISPKETRDSNKVARYLLRAGYEIVPVNPGQKEILGRTCYRSLREIPFPVDLVNLFLNPTRVPEVVEEALERSILAIWMQLGVVHDASAERARRAGIRVVSNRCIMQDHLKCFPSGNTPLRPFQKA